jgi:hypothetical protein
MTQEEMQDLWMRHFLLESYSAQHAVNATISAIRRKSGKPEPVKRYLCVGLNQYVLLPEES